MSGNRNRTSTVARNRKSISEELGRDLTVSPISSIDTPKEDSSDDSLSEFSAALSTSQFPSSSYQHRLTRSRNQTEQILARTQHSATQSLLGASIAELSDEAAKEQEQTVIPQFQFANPIEYGQYEPASNQDPVCEE